jgi:hypothetical protein
MDNDVRDKVKEYYQTHRISFVKLSEQSPVLFNFKVSVEKLKHWSSEDGGWKRPPIDDRAKLKIIADRIFEHIEDDENMDAKDLTSLANVYLAYATKMPPEALGDNKPTLQQIIDLNASGKLD